MFSKISLTTLLFLSLNSAFGQADVEKKIQTQLILAKDGSTVEITEGSFTMTKSLSLEGKKNITIRGKGMDKTILSFKNQTWLSTTTVCVKLILTEKKQFQRLFRSILTKMRLSKSIQVLQKTKSILTSRATVVRLICLLQTCWVKLF